jgi:hypothetical protein
VGVEAGFAGNLRFTVLRRLGDAVYEAIDHERNTRVALKTLSSDPASLMRLKREFRALADLGHPNLVSLGELFSDEQWFFSMELVEGVDFLHWVRPGGVLHERRLRDALVQLAAGLGALHGAGKVHRDVKPSNILVAGGRVVLLDSGILTEAPRPGAQLSDPRVVGTVDYMAPEQAAARPVGPEADWYAVGVLVYQALAGELPFSGTPLEILRAKQMHLPPLPPPPQDLADLALALLTVTPAARPAAAEVVARLAQPGTEVRQPAPETAFVGRAAERAVLAEAFEQSRRGAGATALIGGEAGVGKTALVRAFVDGLSVPVVTLFGRAHEREAVPYKGIDGLIDAAAQFLMRLPDGEAAAFLPQQASLLAEVFPVLRRVAAFAQAPLPQSPAPSLQERRARVFAALRELFARMAAWQPLILVVDDLHWADADSLAALAGILAPPEAPPILFIATSRPDAASRLSELRDALGGVHELSLGRLSLGESLALAERQLSAAGANPGDADSVVREADGHPRFIEELVRHVAAGGAAELVRLDEALGARIVALPREAQTALELLAVAGAPLSQDTLAAAAGVDFAALGRTLALLRSGFLAQTRGARRTDAVELYHERVRDAVMARLDGHNQRRAHQRLALALEAAGNADAERLSIHWEGAGDSERASVRAAQAAKRAAEQLAFDRAAMLFRRAIALRPIDAAGHQAELGAVLAQAGRGADAARAFLAAADGAEPARSADLCGRAAVELLYAGHVDEGLAAAAPVLSALKLRLPADAAAARRLLGRIRLKLFFRGRRSRARDATELPPAMLRRLDLAWAAGTALLLVEPMRGLALLAQHGQTALDAGEPERLARAMALDAVLSAAEGDRDAAKQSVDAAAKLAAGLAVPEHALVDLARGAAPLMAGRFDEAASELTKALAVLRNRASSPWALDAAEILRLLALQTAGRLRAAADGAQPALRDALDRGDWFAAASLRAGLHRVHLAAGDVGRVLADADDVRRRMPARFTLQHWLALFAEVEAHLYAGEAARALKALDRAEDGLAASGLLRSPLIDAATLDLRARAALLSGEKRRRAVARSAASKLAANGTTSLSALIAARLAQIDGERAEPHLEQAERNAARAGLRLQAATAHALLGLGAGGGDRVEASYGVFRQEQIRDPVRFLQLFAPGFAW